MGVEKETIKQVLIFIGYVLTSLIYLRYKEKLKKILAELIPFYVFYILIGALLKVAIQVTLDMLVF